ncbi:purine-binding chemotaxis protein CheW [Caldicellulosiruptor bescii]|uniref:CheW protein n=2 Tax=Caldicellulosiruptor bescii TaxID=31899 RepID=B9MMK9_CALBD|nr:chemotaxis protein CheW [Caldicellulosiruptor bescii]ACM61308.1 CheW protein [Caldicellulosiruptor bescii DSM 6725]PBC88878.1 purine-binding chemotaxis protein CheW [Caldicellulosiruptor bescii]PBC91640.1 purine-binding chemotaxis protein CheW [Caldicellulosiruptor bescii]PBD02947.1 purine-binding chemotaxis protein CheW [Caldicellulosiruptor bescii]PBD07437.1 purine-binding chemotaxis protein CheW [Caldicellulosiruptor bescii]
MSKIGTLDLNVIVFQIGKQNFAFSLDNVKEIIKVPSITPVPLTKSHVAGLINLRGDVIPVLNLREKYRIESYIKSEDARIIIIEKNNVKIGMLVDKVLNISSIDQSQVNECKVTTLEEVKAVIKQKEEDKLITFIDTDKILEENLELSVFQKINIESSISETDETEQKVLKQERYILVQIDGQNYALNIANIQEIIRFSDFSTVPSESDDVLGIINLRNEIIPIINIQKLLKAESKEIDDETKIIIAYNSGFKFGFIVDKILSVISVNEYEIKPLPTIANYKDIFTGTIKSDERMFIILSINKIFEKVSSAIYEEIKNQGEEALEMLKTSDEKQVVLFEINNQKFAIDIQKVKEINRIPSIVKVPNEKVYLKGIANLRGDIIAIIDLGILLYGGETQINDSSRVIIVELRGERFGILAKKVLSVSKVSAENIIEVDNSIENDQMKEKLSNLDIKYIKAIIKHNDDLIIQIDPEIILDE